jgi:hypothetical protein
MRQKVRQFKAYPLWRSILEVGYMLINDHRAEKVYWVNLNKKFQKELGKRIPENLFTTQGIWGSICTHYFDGYILPTESTQQMKDNLFIKDLKSKGFI